MLSVIISIRIADQLHTLQQSLLSDLSPLQGQLIEQVIWRHLLDIGGFCSLFRAPLVLLVMYN